MSEVNGRANAIGVNSATGNSATDNGAGGDFGLYFYEEILHGAAPELAVAQAAQRTTATSIDDPLIIADKQFRSRLMLGTGRYRSIEELLAAIEASGAEIL